MSQFLEDLSTITNATRFGRKRELPPAVEEARLRMVVRGARKAELEEERATIMGMSQDCEGTATTPSAAFSDLLSAFANAATDRAELRAKVKELESAKTPKTRELQVRLRLATDNVKGALNELRERLEEQEFDVPPGVYETLQDWLLQQIDTVLEPAVAEAPSDPDEGPGNGVGAGD